MTRQLFAAAAVAMLAGFAQAGDIKSGPQTGEKVPGPFTPLNVSGKAAGEKHCLFCENGNNPVAMVFARNPECPATQKLLKALDAATAKNSGASMGSFVVFLTDDDKAEAKLKDLAKKEDYKKLVVSVDTPSGPTKYNVSQDADVTVVLYNKREVKANYAFKKGDLKDADIEKVVADVSKITPAQ
jgi:hypothetical protein